MPFNTNCNLFCCCQNSCGRPNNCCPRCRQNRCCCPPRPFGPVFGAGLFFDGDEPYFTRAITLGDLPVTDVTVPLNVFNPLLGMSVTGNSLVVTQGGLYDLRCYIGTQFLSLFPYEVFVAKSLGGVLTPIAETLEQTLCDDVSILPAEAPLERAPLLPLLPRYIAKTTQACLDPGTQLSLVVRLRSIGVLYIMPGALLTAQRIGACKGLPI
ncbi:MAG: hypothetical protein FWE98_03820 [Oscillospiraceae bacterium]|nr:hypothetical protein [Oscillospiraceae bacterium]